MAYLPLAKLSRIPHVLHFTALVILLFSSIPTTACLVFYRPCDTSSQLQFHERRSRSPSFRNTYRIATRWKQSIANTKCSRGAAVLVTVCPRTFDRVVCCVVPLARSRQQSLRRRSFLKGSIFRGGSRRLTNQKQERDGSNKRARWHNLAWFAEIK